MKKLDFRNKWVFIGLMVLGAALFALALNIDKLFGFLAMLWRVLTPIVAGLGVAFVLNVPLRFVEHKCFAFLGKSKSPLLRKLHHPLSLLVTILLVLGLLFLVLFIVIPQVVTSLSDLIQKLPEYGTQFFNRIEQLISNSSISLERFQNIELSWDSFMERVISIMSTSVAKLANYATTLTTSVWSAIVNTFLAIIVAVYVLAQKRRIKDFVSEVCTAYLPTKADARLREVTNLTSECFSRFILGQVTEAFVLGMLCYIGMVIFGFPYELVISVLVTITALIPIVGGFIGAIIGAFLILLVSPTDALFFLLFLIILQQLEGNLIYPKVVGDQVGLPGVLVISMVIIGGGLFGIIGILIFIPLCAVVLALIKQSMRNRSLRSSDSSEQNN